MDPRVQVKFEFVRYTRGYGVDVGRGSSKAFPHMAAVRLHNDEQCEKEKIREIVTMSLVKLPEFDDDKCDFILAADVLTADNAETAIASYLRCVRVDGHVCIYHPDDKVSLTRLETAIAAQQTKVDVVALSEWHAGGVYLVLRKRNDDNPEQVTFSYKEPLPEKRALVIRHGGIGDQLQAAFLFPELKRQGYHITVMATPKTVAPIQHDPHVDDWYTLDEDQVPNGELPLFWKVVGAHYQKTINLNESVEGTFLAVPSRVQHSWPHALRHELLNRNYAEHAAKIAEIPFKAEGRFYASPEEAAFAAGFVSELASSMNKGLMIGERSMPTFNIMWVLSGSSPHKFSPHQDTVMSAILKRLSRATITLVGGMECKILEAGWENEPRVFCRSGELSVRDTLALAQVMDLVIGPETGVLNSVAYNEDVRKVLMLSHSSHENLSKHWLNTAVVAGRAPCYPCHQLHVTSEFCPQDKNSGAALCQQNVSPEELYMPIDAEYTGWAKVQMLRAA